jgi:hypothetical protein
MGSGTLRKRTFAHTWVIVRQNPLQSAKHTEEANVRPYLGDRSPPRQVQKDERSSPCHTRTLARVRTFAHHWVIVRPRDGCSHVTYLGHLPLTYPSLSLIHHSPPLRRTAFSAHRHSFTSRHFQTPPPTTKHHQNTTKSPMPTTTLPHSPFSTNFTPLSPNIHNTNRTNPFWPFFIYLFILTTALCYSRV